MLYLSLKRSNLFLALALLAISGVLACAQQTATPRPAAPAPLPPPVTLSVESSSRQSPQIVTIVHRLTGIKALALLRRNGERVAEVDDEVLTTNDAVTIITAGLVLSDGQNIVARLPQAEAEVESYLGAQKTPEGYYRMSPSQPRSSRYAQEVETTAAAAGYATPAPRAVASPDNPGFFIVQPNGKRFVARYIGLDGGSGLSLLQIQGLKGALSKDAAEEQLTVGQSVRIFAPERIERAPGVASSTVALRVSDIEAKITAIARTSTGKITKLTVRAQNLSPAIVGGVALNEAGESVGIVETTSGGTAHLIPAASVRRAAERVLARQTSVPRPWLGVRGEVVGAMPLEKLSSLGGWTAPEAAALKGKLDGIFLTSVVPGTPAAQAKLRPGDVITRVNNLEIKNAEDFSFALNEAGGGAAVNFTIYRWEPPATTVFTPALPPMAIQPQPAPTVLTPQAFAYDFKPFDVNIKLGEALNPARTLRLAEEYRVQQAVNPFPLVARGIETAALSPKAATHLGANGGILVLYVDADSLAARAGLKVFDVIETIEGKPVGRAALYYALPKGNPQQLRLGIVRDHKRVEIIVVRKDEPQK